MQRRRIMVCKKCGKELQEGDKFCDVCGTVVGTGNVVKDFILQDKKRFGIIVGVVVAIAFVGVLLFSIPAQKDEDKNSETNILQDDAVNSETTDSSENTENEQGNIIIRNSIKYEYNDANKTATVVGWKGIVTDVDIPSEVMINGTAYTVIKIAEIAFKGCVSMTSVSLPETVTEIGMYAFYKCAKLTRVSLPDSVTKVEKWAFAESGVQEVELSKELELPEGVFEGCGHVATIRRGERFFSTEIDGVRYSCSEATGTATAGSGLEGKTSIEILPEIELDGRKYVVTSVGMSENTTVKYVKLPDTITGIWFKGCTSLESINVPKGVKELSDSQFENCYNLKSVTLSEGLESLGRRVFFNCYALESIHLPSSLTNIGRNAFTNCTGLKELVIPSKVTSIYGALCHGCTSLQKVVLPSSITEIQSFAFKNCPSLTVDNINIPEGAKIASDAFDFEITGGVQEEEEQEVQWVEVTNGVLKYIVDYENGIAHVVGIVLANSMPTDITVPSKLWLNGATLQVTEIRAEAFRNREDILNIKVEEGVKKIHPRAFEKCVNLRNVNLPQSLESVGDHAFRDCKSLMMVSIWDNTTLGEGVFDGCDKLILD